MAIQIQGAGGVVVEAKAASTAPVATDPALVVAVSPNSTAVVSSGVAHDGVASSANPALIGGYASAAAPSDVSADVDAVRAWFLRNGAQVIQAAFAGVLATTGNGVAGTGVQRVAIASDNTVLPGVGAGPTGSAVPANAALEGHRAATANPTNATGGNLVASMADKAGRSVITLFNVRELVNSTQTAISSTTETTIVAAAASIFRDLLGLVITTAGAAAQTITIRSGTGGTTKFVLNYPNAAVAPGQPLVLMFPCPIPLLAANTPWTAQQSVATACNYTALWVEHL